MIDLAWENQENPESYKGEADLGRDSHEKETESKRTTAAPREGIAC